MPRFGRMEVGEMLGGEGEQDVHEVGVREGDAQAKSEAGGVVGFDAGTEVEHG